MEGKTLDLNRPEHAKEYVLSWVDRGRVSYEEPEQILYGRDEDYLRVAKQLFLYCDPRPALGGSH